MPTLTGQRTQFQPGAWGGRPYGSFDGKAAAVTATLSDVRVATVRLLMPVRKVVKL